MCQTFSVDFSYLLKYFWSHYCYNLGLFTSILRHLKFFFLISIDLNRKAYILKNHEKKKNNVVILKILKIW